MLLSLATQPAMPGKNISPSIILFSFISPYRVLLLPVLLYNSVLLLIYLCIRAILFFIIIQLLLLCLLLLLLFLLLFSISFLGCGFMSPEKFNFIFIFLEYLCIIYIFIKSSSQYVNHPPMRGR